ncbi:hypothetical protein RF11_05364 [Thelohanellus kitauei]|uniref:Uncharacterized protein n=1 Tax=Thelohanellus kitauei TaxID=669202 RepID=A0A0C2NDX3_THEKT|nr:hypothetical protein RF11_05364 [Thelohanellus kitauei]
MAAVFIRRVDKDINIIEKFIPVKNSQLRLILERLFVELKPAMNLIAYVMPLLIGMKVEISVILADFRSRIVVKPNDEGKERNGCRSYNKIFHRSEWSCPEIIK